MTRTHAARQLLALGPLSFGQFADITGWPISACRRVLSYLVDDTGEAERLSRLYRLTNGKQLSDMQTLESKAKPSDGETAICTMRPGATVGVPATATDVRETQAGCCGRCSREGFMGEQGVMA